MLKWILICASLHADWDICIDALATLFCFPSYLSCLFIMVFFFPPLPNNPCDPLSGKKWPKDTFLKDCSLYSLGKIHIFAR